MAANHEALKADADQIKRPPRLSFMLANDWNLLCGRDVPTWRPGDICVESEMVAKVALFRSETIASAHGRLV